MRGNKFFELTNHLGNVLVTVSDKKLQHSTNNTTVDYYNADVVTANDYYPFGSQMPGRKYSQANSNYRYGFNGHEKDNEVKGEGNQYDYGFRIYDPRIGRFLSTDPLQTHYSAISPYAFALNSPLLFNDPDGRDAIVSVQKSKTGGGEIIISSIVYITGKNANKEKAERLTSKASEVYKGGTYKDKAGKSWTVKFDVKFEYAEDQAKIILKKGENILDFVDEKAVSHTNAINTQTKNAKGEVIAVKQSAATTGIIGKKDDEKTENYSTLHETLHFLGLSDRYTEGKDENGERTTTPQTGFEADIMAKSGEFDINQIHIDNWVQKYSKMPNGTYKLNQKIDKDSKGNLIGTPPTKTVEIPKEESKKEDKHD